MLGGSDATGITLRSIVYHVLKNPEIYRKLRATLKQVDLVYPVPYKDVKDIPYLVAIISEATRVHPATSFALERVVPNEGLRLPDGRSLPPGTIVGMNPWVVNADKAVYGPDADQFLPERWLQRDQEISVEWEDRRRKMRETNLTFGGGKRACLGRNAGLVELYKLTATLFSLYQVSDEPSQRFTSLDFSICWCSH